MKNKFLIGLLAFFAAIMAIIIFLNLSNSKTNKNYDFDRNFSKNRILEFDNKYEWLCNDITSELFNSNFSSIVEGKLKTDKERIEYDLYFTDCNFFNIKYRNLVLPKSNVLLIDNKQVIYSKKFELYKLDLQTNRTIKFDIKNVNICFLISLDDKQNKFLFFGGANIKSLYKTGFFIIDMNNNQVIESKILHTNKNSYDLEKVTMYVGLFQKTFNNNIVFTCERNPNIYFFNKDGFYEMELSTIDNTPMPKIIKDSNNIHFFSRESSKYTNSGVFVDKENIFVFSMASKFLDKIIIDQYSKHTKDYIQSFQLDYNGYNSSDIGGIIMCKDRLIIRFELNYASFKFSRYFDGNFY
jgi:hypothetical protein